MPSANGVPDCITSPPRKLYTATVRFNTTLKFLELQGFATLGDLASSSDQTGEEMAKSIAQKSSLQSITIGMCGSEISDQTGMQMATSIAVNSTLQNFTINMCQSWLH